MGLSLDGVTNWVGDRVSDAANVVVDTAAEATDAVVDTAETVAGAFDPANIADFAQQNFDLIRSAAQTGQQVGNTILGGAMVVTGVVGSIPIVGAPIQVASGVATGAATMANGDFNPQHILRNAVNGPTTLFGTGLALMGGGDIQYNQQNGIWFATGTADWTHGRGGTTYGSMFVTHQPAEDIDGDLLHHESVHGDQYALFGGGIGFPIAYLVEEGRRTLAGEGPGGNRFEQQAGLEEGGYDPP